MPHKAIHTKIRGLSARALRVLLMRFYMMAIASGNRKLQLRIERAVLGKHLRRSKRSRRRRKHSKRHKKMSKKALRKMRLKNLAKARAARRKR